MSDAQDEEPLDPGERRMPPVRTSDERTMLTEMLDWYREGVILKVEDISAEDAAASPLPSDTSIAGLVKHLALVEDGWFTVHFAGLPEPDVWPEIDWEADPNWEFHSARSQPMSDLVELYRGACERSRHVTAEHDLDDLARSPRRRPFTLRWALVHLLEETARHLGHMDILREQLDGTTGE